MTRTPSSATEYGVVAIGRDDKTLTDTNDGS